MLTLVLLGTVQQSSYHLYPFYLTKIDKNLTSKLKKCTCFHINLNKQVRQMTSSYLPGLAKLTIKSFILKSKNLETVLYCQISYLLVLF